MLHASFLISSVWINTAETGKNQVFRYKKQSNIWC